MLCGNPGFSPAISAAIARRIEAESLLTTSAVALAKRFGAADRRVEDAVDRVTRFYESRGDTVRAKAFRPGVVPPRST